MAKLFGRSPSTVSREMSRNGGYDRYRAALADENVWARARRSGAGRSFVIRECGVHRPLRMKWLEYTYSLAIEKQSD
jgi:IS30 family transposase